MVTAVVRLGDGYWLILGPAIIAAALVVWVLLTVRASRKVRRPPKSREGLPDRGAVQGGIIEGDLVQRNRRD